MIVSVHQSQYLPWLGYFHKIVQSDLFVFLDNVQYKKREFQNRNKIRAPEGYLWLTVPVKTRGRYEQKIREVEIDNTENWQHKHWETIKKCYHRAKGFDVYTGFFEDVYKKEWKYLTELNCHIIKFILQCFGIQTPVKYETELEIEGESTVRIVNICKKINADAYLSGQGGKDYMDESLFDKEKIKLEYQQFVHPEYKQQYEPFMPFMSAVDLLFNYGEESKQFFRKGL